MGGRRGGPVCPLGGNMVRLPCVFGEFVMSTISGHTWARPQGGLRCGGGTDSAGAPKDGRSFRR